MPFTLRSIRSLAELFLVFLVSSEVPDFNKSWIISIISSSPPYSEMALKIGVFPDESCITMFAPPSINALLFSNDDSLQPYEEQTVRDLFCSFVG